MRHLRAFVIRFQIELLVGLLIFVFVAPLAGSGGANQLPRIALAAALIDDGSVEITRYEPELGFDYAIKDGRLYSDKAPGSSFVFAPVYGLYRMAGGPDMLTSPRELRFFHKLIVASIPAALLASLMTGYARAFLRKQRSWLALMIAAGTMLLPFASVAFGHALAALLAFSAFLLARSRHRSPWLAVAAGFLVGLGVVVEYPVIIVAAGLLVFLWITARKKVLPFLLGATPMALALLVYHQVAFGHPLQTSYRYAQSLEGEFSGVGLKLPDPADLFDVLLGERGLFVLTPVALFALFGFFPYFRRHVSIPRRELWLSLAIVAAFVIVPAIWIDDSAGPYGGHSPGPRFLVPALPFLIIPLAGVLKRWPVAASVAGGLGIGVMALATLTHPLAAHDTGVPALVQWFDLVAERTLRANVIEEALGPLGWVLHVSVVALTLAVLVRQTRREPSGSDSALV